MSFLSPGTTARRWPSGCESEFLTVIFPREQKLKNSLPTSAPFFAGWLSRPVMARRENNFWRFAECNQHSPDILLLDLLSGRCPALARLFSPPRRVALSEELTLLPLFPSVQNSLLRFLL
jgi:hypothetical protein